MPGLHGGVPAGTGSTSGSGKGSRSGSGCGIVIRPGILQRRRTTWPSLVRQTLEAILCHLKHGRRAVERRRSPAGGHRAFAGGRPPKAAAHRAYSGCERAELRGDRGVSWKLATAYKVAVELGAKLGPLSGDQLAWRRQVADMFFGLEEPPTWEQALGEEPGGIWTPPPPSGGVCRRGSQPAPRSGWHCCSRSGVHSSDRQWAPTCSARS